MAEAHGSLSPPTKDVPASQGPCQDSKASTDGHVQETQTAGPAMSLTEPRALPVPSPGASSSVKSTPPGWYDGGSHVPLMHPRQGGARGFQTLQNAQHTEGPYPQPPPSPSDPMAQGVSPGPATPAVPHLTLRRSARCPRARMQESSPWGHCRTRPKPVKVEQELRGEGHPKGAAARPSAGRGPCFLEGSFHLSLLLLFCTRETQRFVVAPNF